MSVPIEHREAEGHLPTSSCLPPWRVFRPNVPTRLQPSFVLNRFRTRLCGSSAHGVYPDQVEPSRPWIFLSPFDFRLSTPSPVTGLPTCSDGQVTLTQFCSLLYSFP